MITEESKQAILSLYQRGVHIRRISLIMKVSRNTVKSVIRGKRQTPQRESSHEELSPIIREVFAAVSGNAVRVQEILENRCGRKVSYSTLTRIVRDLDLK